MKPTKRLEYRPFEPHDAKWVLDLLNSRGWLDFIGDKDVSSIQEARRYIEKNLILHDSFLGMWCIQLKKGQVPIGMVGFNQRSFLDHPDLGYALLPRFTGKGYAREAAEEAVSHAFGKGKASRIFALTHPQNLQSIALLRSLNFVFSRIIDPPGEGDSWLFEKGK